MKKITQIRTSQRLRDEALEQLRQSITYFEENCPTALTSTREALDILSQKESSQLITIDRAKNLETAMLLIKMKPELGQKLFS